VILFFFRINLFEAHAYALQLKPQVHFHAFTDSTLCALNQEIFFNLNDVGCHLFFRQQLIFSWVALFLVHQYVLARLAFRASFFVFLRSAFFANKTTLEGNCSKILSPSTTV